MTENYMTETNKEINKLVKNIFNSPREKKKRKLDPKIIRIGDKIKIINPEIITRVGYPMSFNDAIEDVEKIYRNEIIDFLNKTIYKSFEVNSIFKVEVLKY